MRKLSACLLAMTTSLLLAGGAGAWAKGVPRSHVARHIGAARTEKKAKTPKAPKAPKAPKSQMGGELAKKSTPKRRGK